MVSISKKPKTKLLVVVKLPTTLLHFVAYFLSSGEMPDKNFFVLLHYSDSTIFEEVIWRRNYLVEP